MAAGWLGRKPSYHLSGQEALLGAVLAFAAVGCVPGSQTVSPASATPAAVLSGEELADAIRFRAGVGLRADEAWILLVASDPASAPGRVAYGTPLTAAEKMELDRRAANGVALSGVTERYGEGHTEDWAGGFIDQESGVFVAQFTSNLAEHETALRKLVHPNARLELRSAQWSLAELDARADQVKADRDWLRTIDAWYAGSGVYVTENRVVLDVSSKNPQAGTLAMDHYHGEGWLIVRSDGIGRWEGPRGTAVISAVTKSGEPARHLDCVLIPDDPAASLSSAYGTGFSGTCRIEGVGATGYNIELKVLPEDGSDWVVVGRGRLLVPPDGEGRVTIQVDLP